MDKGLKLLFSTYWSSRSWNYDPPTEKDFEQAIQEGYMFAPMLPHTHDEALAKLRIALGKISPSDIANAFLYSLSTRALHYRSALGSYYYALSIPDHSHADSKACYFCDWLKLPDSIDLTLRLPEYNIFNFERYKWGGIRHTCLEYALFDLEQFLLLPKVTPDEKDFSILKSILQTIDELPAQSKAGAYRALITKKKLLKSNKSEVEVLLDILGICGVLSGKDAPCYCNRFVNVYARSPIEHTNDYAYPVNRWHASDGVNEDRFEKVFGFRYADL